MKRSLQVAGWVGATVLLWYLVRRADPGEVLSLARRLDWRWVLGAIAANAAILVSWTALWWTVSPRRQRPRWLAMFEINSIASALMNTVPFMGGHAAAVVMLVKRGGLSQQGALSVMALDQLGEGLAKVTVFLLVGLLAPVPDWMRTGIVSVSTAVGLLLCGLLVAAHAHRDIRGRASSGVVGRVRRYAAEWASQMEALRDAGQAGQALVFAIGTKAAEVAGLLCVQAALGVHLSIGASLLVLAAIMIASMLPIAPGNIGTYEAGAFMAYRHLGVDDGTATVLAIAAHACFMLPSVGIGYAVLSAQWLRGTSLSAATPVAPPPLVRGGDPPT